MTVEYVDAGEAIDQGRLSGKLPGNEVAPPVVAGVDYERLLGARSEPENWLTYYGAYDGQRYSSLDQINTENVKRIGPAWVFQAGSSGMIAADSRHMRFRWRHRMAPPCAAGWRRGLIISSIVRAWRTRKSLRRSSSLKSTSQSI